MIKLIALLFVIIIPIFLLLAIISDYLSVKNRGPKIFILLGKYAFKNFYASTIVFESLLVVLLLSALSLNPDLFLTSLDDTIIFFVFSLLCIAITFGCVHSKFHPTISDKSPGKYIEELIAEKSMFPTELEKFFKNLITRYENQPERQGTEEYLAAKEELILRDDNIGNIFRKALNEYTRDDQRN